MRFIVEHYTSNGTKKLDLEAQSYREVESKLQEYDIEDSAVKCIREIRTGEDKKVS